MVFGGLIGSPQDIQRSFQLVYCLNMPYKAPDTPLRKKTFEMSWYVACFTFSGLSFSMARGLDPLWKHTTRSPPGSGRAANYCNENSYSVKSACVG
jgi:hypothetical protein